MCSFRWPRTISPRRRLALLAEVGDHFSSLNYDVDFRLNQGPADFDRLQTIAGKTTDARALSQAEKRAKENAGRIFGVQGEQKCTQAILSDATHDTRGMGFLKVAKRLLSV